MRKKIFYEMKSVTYYNKHSNTYAMLYKTYSSSHWTLLLNGEKRQFKQFKRAENYLKDSNFELA